MPAFDYAELEKRLARGEYFPAVLLQGSEAYLRERCRNLLIEKFVPEGAREWAVASYSARDVECEEVLRRAQTRPMLSPMQVLVVQDAEAWQTGAGEEVEEPEGARGRGKLPQGAADQLAEYFEDPPDFSMLILEAVSLDQRMKLYKVLAEHALVVATELDSSKDADQKREAAIAACEALIPKLARELGAEITPEAAAELADTLNGSLTQARCELEKLALYAGGRPITVSDVEALVASARLHSVWQFAAILAQRDRRRAFQFLDSVLQEGDEPVAIVGAMAWMYRKLLEAQELPRGIFVGEAANRLRMRRDTAQVALAECGKIPRQGLVEGLQALYAADSQLKQSSGDDRAILEFLVARLTAGFDRPNAR
jgi:DNA polymerase-3 subunit delta